MRKLTKEEVLHLLEMGEAELDGELWEEMEEVPHDHEFDGERMTVFSVTGVGMVSLLWVLQGGTASSWAQTPLPVRRGTDSKWVSET